jgi:hypothetical protein
MNEAQELLLQDIVLRKVKFDIRKTVSKQVVSSLSARATSDMLAEQISLQLQGLMLGNTIHREIRGTVRWPRSWWQAFKEAWYPQWLAKRFPVQYSEAETSTEFIHVCPHLDAPLHDYQTHIRFMSRPDQLQVGMVRE